MTNAGASSARVAAYVLAGGESRRMGQDKALVEFAGKPLVAHALGILRRAVLDAGFAAQIAGARAELEQFAPVTADAEPGQGPLGGICAALAKCPARRAIFIPVDMPLLPPGLVTFLIRRATIADDAITVTSVTGYAQSFPVIVDRAALPWLEKELNQGHGGCYAGFLAAAAGLGQQINVLPVEYLAQTGQVAHPDGLPSAFWFLNVNTPAELRRAEALLARPA